MNRSNQYERYKRQILLTELGEAGQQKLLTAKVLVIGAGGLGCPALQYLAAAGLGTIGILDFDVVEITNLQRQVLYTINDLGKSKAITAAAKLSALNPEIQIDVYNVQLTNKNSLSIIANYDVVIDGSDNYATRYLVNDVCSLLNIPLVYGAVFRFEGQVAVFNLADPSNGIITNYRDFFPHPPDPASSPSCNEAGVLGVLPGLIGTMQATEAIKIITGIGRPLHNRLLSYNALENSMYEFLISPGNNSNQFTPKDKLSIEGFDYEWFCNATYGSEISPEEFDIVRANEPLTIIDVREKDEVPVIDEFPALQIPLTAIQNWKPKGSVNSKIVVFCQSGRRSLQATRTLKTIFPEADVQSLKGGIETWLKKQAKYTYE